MRLLGYYHPGGDPTICWAGADSTPLTKTTLIHEEAHENLASWSTLGHLLRILVIALHNVPDHQAEYREDLDRTFQVLIDASRYVHEGYATFWQLLIIAEGMGDHAVSQAHKALIPEYKRAIEPFSDILACLRGVGRSADTIGPCVRAFAIAALNNQVFSVCPDLSPQSLETLRNVIGTPSYHPTARLEALVRAVASGVLDADVAAIHTRMDAYENSLTARFEPEERLSARKAYSKEITVFVLQQLSSVIPIDLAVLDGPSLRDLLLRTITSSPSADLKRVSITYKEGPVAPRDAVHMVDFPSDLDRPLTTRVSAEMALERIRSPIHAQEWNVLTFVRGVGSDSGRYAAHISKTLLLINNESHRVSSLLELSAVSLEREQLDRLVRASSMVVYPLELFYERGESTEFIEPQSRHVVLFERRPSVAALVDASQAFISGPQMTVLSLYGNVSALVLHDCNGRRGILCLLSNEALPMFLFYLKKYAATADDTGSKPILRGRWLVAAWFCSFGFVGDVARMMRDHSAGGLRPAGGVS